jgi:PTH1 family peptidyl-tRNA hydrolase
MRGRAPRTGTPADLLVVGLGNPGAEFAGTRHNVGFEIVDELARRHGGRLRKGKERALVGELTIGGSRVALAEPQTFMNDSGASVGPLVRRFGIDDMSRLVIVHDELDLPLGRMKVKVGGGLAGHNGLRSIRDHLRTSDFIRIRIGVGKPVTKYDGADHVLSKVGKSDGRRLTAMVQLGADAVETIIAPGIDDAMTRFNGVDLDADEPGLETGA